MNSVQSIYPINGQILNNIYPNPVTGFVKTSFMPNIGANTFISPRSCVIGAVVIGDNVHVAPFASVRADEGAPIYIGSGSNIQDGVVIHGLKDQYVERNGYKASVYIGNNVSLAHQSQVHGPAKIGNNVFVGMQSFVFKSVIGDNVVIEPGAKVIGVTIKPNSYVPAGTIVKTQEEADKLPQINNNYAYKDLNHEVTEVNKELSKGYMGVYSYPQSQNAFCYPQNYYYKA